MISGFSFKAILGLVGVLGIPGLAYVGWKQFESWMQRRQERESHKNEIKQKNKELQDSYNRPKSDADVLERLRNPKRHK